MTLYLSYEMSPLTCCTVLHSVTCHLTQVNTPLSNPIQRPVLDVLTPEGRKTELTCI